jgi:hypothetical protein
LQFACVTLVMQVLPLTQQAPVSGGGGQFEQLVEFAPCQTPLQFACVTLVMQVLPLTQQAPVSGGGGHGFGEQSEATP